MAVSRCRESQIPGSGRICPNPVSCPMPTQPDQTATAAGRGEDQQRPGPYGAGGTGGGVVLAAGPGPGDGRGRGAGWRDQPGGRARGELLRLAGLGGGGRSLGWGGHRSACAAVGWGERAIPAAARSRARARSRAVPWPGPGVPAWPSRPAAAVPGSVRRPARALAVRHAAGGVHCPARTRCSRHAPNPRRGSSASGPVRTGLPARIQAQARRRVTGSGVSWNRCTYQSGWHPISRRGSAGWRGRAGPAGYQTGYRPP